ncbi:MAG: nucleotidyl transferase AbiEii/AbiGii toxin family protein [Erysipelotrichaceae bacterium]|nr:nucleotidyl transferase AbiEii/AbiGii toxin family protein [Erysipelotrichaceae bacterium]
MINQFIYEKLKNDRVETIDQGINSLRQIIQGIILLALYKNGFFRNCAFYGGTCLRIFHGLERFSEDLDFCATDDKVISLDQYEKGIIDELNAYGLSAQINKKTEYDTGEILRRYIDIPIYDFFAELYDDRNLKMNRERQLSVKLELDTVNISGAEYENQILMTPNFASINCFDMPSLFSGKLHALICRNWGKRVKGRDYYDYLYYLRLESSFNLSYLQNKLAYTFEKDAESFDYDLIKKMLAEKFENVEIDMIIKDIEPFVSEKEDLSYINKEILIASIDKLKIG